MAAETKILKYVKTINEPGVDAFLKKLEAGIKERVRWYQNQGVEIDQRSTQDFVPVDDKYFLVLLSAPETKIAQYSEYTLRRDVADRVLSEEGTGRTIIGQEIQYVKQSDGYVVSKAWSTNEISVYTADLFEKLSNLSNSDRWSNQDMLLKYTLCRIYP